MARFRIALLVAIGGAATIALLAACNAVLGLGDYSEVACTDDCDAGIDAPNEADAPLVPDAAPSEASIDAEAGSYNPGFAWASWQMPNPVNDAGYPNPASYDASADGGVVFDGVTKLTWENNGANAPSRNSVSDAQKYCADLPTNGGGWRLPTRIELVTLIDYSVTSASVATIDPIFVGTPRAVYWTASPEFDPSVDGGISGTWVIDFTTGDVTTTPPSTTLVRCVRGGVSR